MPVTAEDVKFSLGLWTDPNIGYEYSFYDEIIVLDSHTLRVVFKEPVRGKIFIYDWLAMLPRHLLEPLDRDRIFSWPFWIQPVGNGPYRYVRHVPSVMTELEANPQFYGDAPGVSRVVLRFGGSGLTELLSGNADIASRLTPVQAAQLAADPRFRLYHSVQYGHHIAIVWNHRRALFSDAEVRRALTMALDRRELNRILNYPEDLPIFDVPITKRHHVQGVIPDPLPFSPERSAELLERAGWIDTDNDGIREKDGRAFEFTLSTTEKTVGEAVFIQEQFRQVGVHMEISTYERQTLKHRLQSSHDFDAAIQKYNYIENFDESPDSGYSNPEVIRIRDFVWFTIDQEAADEQMLELWRIFEEEVPVTYLHPTLSYLGAHRRVSGLRNDEDLFLLVEQLSIQE
jgi:peptide/nickel transport system substrate-binding protein